MAAQAKRLLRAFDSPSPVDVVVWRAPRPRRWASLELDSAMRRAVCGFVAWVVVAAARWKSSSVVPGRVWRSTVAVAIPKAVVRYASRLVASLALFGRSAFRSAVLMVAAPFAVFVVSQVDPGTRPASVVLRLVSGVRSKISSAWVVLVAGAAGAFPISALCAEREAIVVVRLAVHARRFRLPQGETNRGDEVSPVAIERHVRERCVAPANGVALHRWKQWASRC